MNRFKISGNIVALITPMDKYGKIDKYSLKNLINYHCNNKTNALLITGTTGEFFTLDYEERKQLLLWTLEFNKDRLPIIVGIGSSSTHQAIKIMKYFQCYDISSYLSITPYYICPSQYGIYQHFKTISEHVSIPQLIYNNPKRSGCDILPKTIIKLSKIDNIIGIKETVPDINRIKIISNMTNNFSILNGNDDNILSFMISGGNGVISVLSNIATNEISSLIKLINDKEYHKAKLIFNDLLPLCKILTSIAPNPVPIKWICKELGLISSDTIRLPLTKLSNNKKTILRSIVSKTKLDILNNN
ncbi:MAG: 4-hydroxy-tetrahydrodipicolinate synthase [Candidatus Lightella neohaematopini]|nr:4-hydroxy-tetrahydrodipicolinate synthase [Candidatus Lightella neohaematopini]MCV2528936.1 4-hydroxy-tetrahydrodipicolinate synthase [Candidatus Lightella neohaematopini]